MNKKIIIISRLYSLFLLVTLGTSAFAQGTEGVDNYYSNRQKGIKPNAPHAYIDSSVASTSDNITVELTGYIPDTSVRDTTPEFRLDRRELVSEGWGLYPCDPWFGAWHSSFYDPWYCPWGYNHWMMSHYWGCGYYWGWNYGWGYGPYWSWGYGPYWSWGYGWGYPWYWEPYYYHAYYGAYAWGYPQHGYSNNNGLVLGTRGSSTRGGVTNFTSQSRPVASSGKSRTSSSSIGRGTVRRGGVDLNNGGRAPRGNVSGTGTVSTRGVSDNSRGGMPTGSWADQRGRYAKPSVATTGRTSSTASRSTGTTRGTTTSRTSSSFRSNYDNSSSSSFRSNSSSSSSRSSSYRSSSSSSRSSSSYRSNSSSSRSSSSFRSSGSSSSFRSSGSSSSSSRGRR